MRVTFVRPNLCAARSADAMEPLCFAVLQALTPPDVETVLYDERIEPIPLDEPTDVAALTVETYTARRAYQIADAYRRRGVRVILGGYHPTFLPDEARRHADAVVCGDAEPLWPRVVRDAERGRLAPLYRHDGFAPLGGVSPDRSIFAGKRYARMALVQYGRGCRYNCEFCSIRAYYGADVRQRPLHEVVDEIERDGRRHVFLVDDNIFVDVPKATELFRALIPLNIRWSCQVSIDVAQDRVLVDLMRRSGCVSAVIGFESLDARNLAQMNKRWNLRHGSYARAIGTLQDAGVMIYGCFVFGYDRDTADAFDGAVAFAQRHRFTLANFNPLTPMPGARLYRRLEREGRLRYDRWWRAPEYRYGDAAFHPRAMTAQQLTDGCRRARTRFSTARSILHRALDRRTHLRSPSRLGLYALANVVSRREIHAKQGRPLGAADPVLPEPVA